MEHSSGMLNEQFDKWLWSLGEGPKDMNLEDISK